MRRCAVIGSPIAHSLSPALHKAAYEELGLDWVYERHEVRAGGVTDFVDSLDEEWRGLSVTMPCKKAILDVGIADRVVQDLLVGNTVIFNGHPSNRATTRVFNTDVSGVEMLLVGEDPSATYLVYGNGATARSCIYALSRLGIVRVGVKARNDEKTRELAHDGARWGIEVGPAPSTADILISTVPAAVGAEWGTASAGLVFDVLYDPWPTGLVVQARRQGVTTLTGLDLLAAQAIGQVELMTGCVIDFSILRRAADDAMAQR